MRSVKTFPTLTHEKRRCNLRFGRELYWAIHAELKPWHFNWHTLIFKWMRMIFETTHFAFLWFWVNYANVACITNCCAHTYFYYFIFCTSSKNSCLKFNDWIELIGPINSNAMPGNKRIIWTSIFLNTKYWRKCSFLYNLHYFFNPFNIRNSKLFVMDLLIGM